MRTCSSIIFSLTFQLFILGLIDHFKGDKRIEPRVDEPPGRINNRCFPFDAQGFTSGPWRHSSGPTKQIRVTVEGRSIQEIRPSAAWPSTA